MSKKRNGSLMTLEIKALARPALAIIWSIIWAAIYFSSGSVPAFVTGITATCVGWFFGSREKEKARGNSTEGS